MQTPEFVNIDKFRCLHCIS